MYHKEAGEMVIEFVGDVVKPLMSDIREKRCEKQVWFTHTHHLVFNTYLRFLGQLVIHTVR